ncbi:TRIC channel domain-containing protein [Ditylenchus destructor]|nr:TRIC channel domain-containing protein [Ditylenchus destructor]
MHWPSSLRVDQEILLTSGSYVQRLKMYPYFDIAHYILMVCTVRDDLGLTSAAFSRRHPLSCWLSSMVVCFAGSFLANFLLGEPIVAIFKKHDDIILASIVWYLIFYSPFDIAYKISKVLPVKIFLCILKETQRCYKIHHGVVYASKLYPNAYLIHILVGTAKGAGSGIIRILEQLLRGVWMPQQSEILRPTFTTKACVVASIIFALDKNTTLINLPHEITYLGLVVFFVYFKLSAILLNVVDPLAPFENLFCAVFMGGIWDALSRAIMTSRERRTATTNGKIQDQNGTTEQHKKDQ